MTDVATASKTYYSALFSESQEFFFLVREFQRQGNAQEKAVALADCEMSEIRYCDDCGMTMTLNRRAAAWECPVCGLKVPL